MHLLEPRPQPSQLMRWTAPLIAIVATLLVGSGLFLALGKDPLQSFKVFFVEPLTSSYGWSELLIKACPLILIAQGLAIGFKARIYNIGAEGQLIVGALAGGGIAIQFGDSGAAWVLPAMVLAGAVGGALWGAIPALLKTRFNAEETLTTLMLAYVASFLLSYMVNGPWRDPEGMNFPQSVMFADGALFPILLEGSRVNGSVFITLFAVLGFWLFNAKSFLAYQLEVGGQAPAAAAKPAIAPIKIMPSTPRLITPLRSATSSPSPAKISGVAAASVPASTGIMESIMLASPGAPPPASGARLCPAAARSRVKRFWVQSVAMPRVARRAYLRRRRRLSIKASAPSRKNSSMP